jgi:hypothetical protein
MSMAAPRRRERKMRALLRNGGIGIGLVEIYNLK